MQPDKLSDYSLPELNALREFRDLIKAEHRDEANHKIAYRVIECLMFIKINEAWLRYAVEHKDNSAIYTLNGDQEKQVLRAPNGISFHILSYDDADTAVSDYQSLIAECEQGIAAIKDDPIKVRRFIRLIKDSDIGCMEDRLVDARPFLNAPNFVTLRQLFHDWQIARSAELADDCAKADIAHHFYEFFKSHIKSFVHNEMTAQSLELNWDDLFRYYQSVYLKPLRLETLSKTCLPIATDEDEVTLVFCHVIDAQFHMAWAIALWKRSADDPLFFEIDELGYLNWHISLDEFQSLQAEAKLPLWTPISSLSDLERTIAIAVRTNDTKAIATLLRRYEFLKTAIYRWTSPLLVAIQQNNTAIIRFLIDTFRYNIYRSHPTIEGKKSYIQFAFAHDSEQFELLLTSTKERNEAMLAELLLETQSKALLANKALLLREIPTLASHDKAILFHAIEKEDTALLKLLMASPFLNLNVRKHGRTPLELATAKENEDVVTLLLQAAELDLDCQSQFCSEKIRVARENQLQKLKAAKHELKFMRQTAVKDAIALALSAIPPQQRKQQAQLLEARFATKATVPSYKQYCRSLHKVPDEATYLAYLKDIYLLFKRVDLDSVLTDTEREAVKTRLLWREMLAEIEAENARYCLENDIRQEVIARLKGLISHVDYEILLDDLMQFIRDQIVLTHAFKAHHILEKDLSHFQLLNILEAKSKSRDRYELAYFEKDLSPELFKRYRTSPGARPRYGLVHFTDRSTPLTGLADYGESFLVFKEVVKHSALFVAGNPTLSHEHNRKLCTLAHPEILLRHCPLPTLKALVQRFYHGAFINRFDQQNFTADGGGYMVALLPALNFLSPNVVELIHIAKHEYTLPREIKLSLQAAQINIINASSQPYRKLETAIRQHCRDNRVGLVESLLSYHPSLRLAVDSNGQGLVHIAAYHGYTKLLAVLEQQGCAMVDYRYRASILEIAMTQNHPETVRHILARLSALRGMSERDLLEERRAPQQIDTALTLAVKHNARAALDVAYECKVDVDSRCLNNKTLITLAYEAGHTELLIDLLKQGADPMTLLGSAFDKPQPISLDWIERFATAIRENNRDGISEYINAHPHWAIVPLNPNGQCAIDLAIIAHNEALFVYLFEITYERLTEAARSKLGARRPHITSYLQYAIRHHLDDCVAHQLDRGCDVNIQDSDLNTPLHLAVYMQKPALYTRLVEAHANPYIHNRDGLMPYELTQYEQAPLNNPAREDRLALHRAVEGKDLETILAYKLRHPNWISQVRLDAEKTVLTKITEQWPYAEFIKAIAGCDLSHLDGNQQSALEVAALHGDFDKLVYLLKHGAKQIEQAFDLVNASEFPRCAELLGKPLLQSYIKRTEQRPEQIGLAGFFMYTKKDKLLAAKTLQAVLGNKTGHERLRQHIGALSQGRLSKIWRVFSHHFEQPSIKPRAARQQASQFQLS